MKPEISIIVPIYNVEKYLPRCIESILAQTFTNFELILVNDGSEDDSGEVCDRYAKEDKRIKVIHKKNGGVSSARNAGLKNSIGNYIGFVDPDDYIKKDMFNILYNLCKKNNADISICKNSREINGKVLEGKTDMSIKELSNNEAMKELFKAELYRFALWNKLFRYKCFEGVLFPEGRIHEDLSITYKLIASAQKVMFINYEGYIYVKRDLSILTQKYNENRLQSFKAWNEIIEFMKQKYENILDYAITCYIYWSIDNIYYILNQVDDEKARKKYLLQMRQYLNKHYTYIRNNKMVAINKKYILLALIYNYYLLIVIYQVKLKIKSIV